VSGETTPVQPSIESDCDRKRCSAEPKTHTLTNYHYISNTRDAFRSELYNDGPFYTSYHVYEDFTWFFNNYPKEAYNLQWGQNMGGHAVVIIGWEASCTYHDGDYSASSGALLASTGGDASGAGSRSSGARRLMRARAALHRQHARASRRRTSTGPCWHLRNTWGAEWADGGYFRMHEDMLTGPEGKSLHIASAAGDGVESRSP